MQYLRRGKNMIKKPDTPRRLYQRKYESLHKEERIQKNKVFATSMPRELCEDIEAYLKKYQISKVDFIRDSYLRFLEETKNNKGG